MKNKVITIGKNDPKKKESIRKCLKKNFKSRIVSCFIPGNETGYSSIDKLR